MGRHSPTLMTPGHFGLGAQGAMQMNTVGAAALGMHFRPAAQGEVIEQGPYRLPLAIAGVPVTVLVLSQDTAAVAKISTRPQTRNMGTSTARQCATAYHMRHASQTGGHLTQQ